MALATRTRINLTTPSDGTSKSELAPQVCHGLLYKVTWIDGDYADGVDAVLSVTDTPSGVDETVLTLTNANDDARYYPRHAEHDNTGTALLTTSIPLISGRLKLTVTSGGNSKTGGIIAYVIEE